MKHHCLTIVFTDQSGRRHPLFDPHFEGDMALRQTADSRHERGGEADRGSEEEGRGDFCTDAGEQRQCG